MAKAISPPFTAGFIIQVGATQLDATYPVVFILIDKTINKIPYAEIVLRDGDPEKGDFPVCNLNTFEVGEKITLQVAYPKADKLLFEGVIVGQKIRYKNNCPAGSKNNCPAEYIIMSKDIAYRTTLQPKVRHFTKMKDSDILSKILRTYTGLAQDIQATTVEHESLPQHEITDWDFINLRAEANGQVVIVDNGKITITKPHIQKSPTLTLTYGVDQYDFEVAIDARDQWEGAQGCVWNASNQTFEKETTPDPGEHSFGSIGYRTLSRVNEQEARSLYHMGTLAPTEMKTLAASLVARSRMAKIQGKLTLTGDATIQLNTTVELKKGTAIFQGKAYLSGLRHIVYAGHWSTELTLGLDAQRYITKHKDVAPLPAAGMLSPIHGLQTGIVKKWMQDPQSVYRIFVHLPLLHQPDEGIWCRIASFYASQQAGAFFMPELEDEVVVGFFHDDPRSPVILGALYSKKHPPPVTLDEKNTQKTIVSKNKLVFTFNDTSEGPEIILQTPKGRTIRMSDKDEIIELINGSVNKILLGKKNIEISSSNDIILQTEGSIYLNAKKNIALDSKNDLQAKSTNVSIQADNKTKIKGQSSAELISSSIVIIDGKPVNINC